MSCPDLPTLAAAYAATVPYIQYNIDIVNAGSSSFPNTCTGAGCYSFTVPYTYNGTSTSVTGTASPDASTGAITSFNFGSTTASLTDSGFTIGSCTYTVNGVASALLQSTLSDSSGAVILSADPWVEFLSVDNGDGTIQLYVPFLNAVSITTPTITTTTN